MVSVTMINKGLGRSMRRKVFVTGMGCITSLGDNCKELLTSLREGKTGIGESVYFNNLAPDIKVAAEIKQPIVIDTRHDEELLRRIRKVIRKKSTLPIESTISSILDALFMAEIPQAYFKGLEGKTGLVVGGNNLTQNTQYLLHKRYNDSIDFVSPKYALEFFDTNFVGVLSELFGIESEGFSIGGASASGNVAILQAYRMIAYGILDACVVVSPVADFSPFELNAFKNLGVFGNSFYEKPEQACRPFDVRHEGFVLGQGSGAILLESAEYAQKRGAKLYGEILGGAMKLDGNHLSDASALGEQTCMEQAMKDAGLFTSEIEYINTHGTSTPLGDKMEAIAISNIFKSTKPWVNSSKSMIGHCMYSAGILEVIITLLQMNHNFIHPNVNLDCPLEECAGLSMVGKSMMEKTIHTAISNSFGFGGINTSIILRNAEQEREL